MNLGWVKIWLWINLYQILVIFVIMGRAWADDEASFRVATALLEAESYEDAYHHYRALAEQQKSLWEKGVVHLQAGRALAGLSAEQAANFSLQIVQKSPPMPALLKRDFNAFLASKLAESARVASGQYPPSKELLDEAYERLQLAYSYIKEAKVADCELQKIKGYAFCRDNPRLQALTSWVNRGFSILAQAERAEFLSPRELNEAVWRWQILMLVAKERLDTLAELGTKNILSQSYLNSYTTEIKSWYTLIEALHALAATHREAVAANDLHEHYQHLLADLKQGDLKEAHQVWQRIEVVTDKLTQAIYGDIPGQQALYLLAADYERILKKLPPQKLAVEVLLQHTAAVSDKFGTDKTWREALLKAYRLTEKALEALGQKKQRLSSLLLARSQYLLLQILHSEVKLSSEAISRAIETQEYAARLTWLAARESQNLSSEEQQLLHEGQQDVEQAIQAFLQVVYQRQHKEFYGSPSRCQKHPWVEVLPLFYKGSNAAEVALSALEGKEIPSLKALIEMQKLIVTSWREALQKINQPLVSGDDSCYGKGGDASKEGKQPASGKDESNKPNPQEIVDVLRRVQMMQNDDRLEKKNIPHKKNNKSW